jgi:hypothetical protein
MSATTGLGITLIEEGQDDKEGTANDGFGVLDARLTKSASVDVTSGNVTLSAAEYQQNAVIFITGATTGGRTVTTPALRGVMVFRSNPANTQSVSIVRGSTSLALAPGQSLVAAQDGTTNDLSALLRGQQAAPSFIGLSDVPASFSGQGGKILKVNAGGTAVEFEAGGAGVTDFTDLGDVPTTYTGQAGKLVGVKGDESGLEFTSAGTSGWETITDTAATSTANIAFTLDAGYRAFRIIIESVRPASGTNQLVCRIAQDGVPNYISSANSYYTLAHTQNGSSGGHSVTGATSGALTHLNVATSTFYVDGEVLLFPGAAGVNAKAQFNTAFVEVGLTGTCGTRGHIRCDTTTARATHISFFWSGGQNFVATGRIILQGLPA